MTDNELLAPAEAVKLLDAGKRQWNHWAKENPNVECVEFSGQEFSAGTVFSGIRMPENCHSVHFAGCIFGEGVAGFSGIDFGDAWVTFQEATFADLVYFQRTRFGAQGAYFAGAHFLSGADFNECVFPGDYTVFRDCRFEGGSVAFRGCKFIGRGLSFSGSDFGESKTDFSQSEFLTVQNDFRFCHFRGPAHFSELKLSKKLKSFTFEGSAFESLFTISHEDRMSSPLDLRRTKLSHSLVLNDLHCDFRTKRRRSVSRRVFNYVFAFEEDGWSWSKTAVDRNDSQRFRRLKEIAFNNRNHTKALEFHAQELRSRRGWEGGFFHQLAQLSYWLFSDYGRAILRPTLWLVVLWLSSAFYYWAFSDLRYYDADRDVRLETALSYSASNMLSFVPSSRTASRQGEEMLFASSVPDVVLAVAALQSILSVILLFFLGLALRNQFRV